MSTEVNTNLIEEANDYIRSGDLSSMGVLEKALIADIEAGDLEALSGHLRQAREFLRDE